MLTGKQKDNPVSLYSVIIRLCISFASGFEDDPLKPVHASFQIAEKGGPQTKCFPEWKEVFAQGFWGFVF